MPSPATARGITQIPVTQVMPAVNQMGSCRTIACQHLWEERRWAQSGCSGGFSRPRERDEAPSRAPYFQAPHESDSPISTARKGDRSPWKNSSWASAASAATRLASSPLAEQSRFRIERAAFPPI